MVKCSQALHAIFYTAIDPTPKFPVISDDELLTKVQEQTFKYFWGLLVIRPAVMARERNTFGRSGLPVVVQVFGLMSIIVGY
jgi:hypothetical protein